MFKTFTQKLFTAADAQAFGLRHCAEEHCFMVDAEHGSKFAKTPSFYNDCMKYLDHKGRKLIVKRMDVHFHPALLKSSSPQKHQDRCIGHLTAAADCLHDEAAPYLQKETDVPMD